VHLAAAIGNGLEWFDFAVYGYFANDIGQLFFPSENSTLQLIASFAVFAIGYLMRPIGSLLPGLFLIGQRNGTRMPAVIAARPAAAGSVRATYPGPQNTPSTTSEPKSQPPKAHPGAWASGHERARRERPLRAGAGG
jgi:hypothetical protein